MIRWLVDLVESWPRWARMLFGWVSIGGSFFLLALNGTFLGLPQIWQAFCLLAGIAGCIIFTLAFWDESMPEDS